MRCFWWAVLVVFLVCTAGCDGDGGRLRGTLALERCDIPVCVSRTYENGFFVEFICAFRPFLPRTAKNVHTKTDFF